MLVQASDIHHSVIELFEQARRVKGAPYEPQRFMAFLTEPPLRKGRRVADSFGGRRRFVRFMESVELTFGVCFTVEEWERGCSLDEFVKGIETKLSRPEQAHRLALKRLAEARLLDEPLKIGLFTVPLLVAAVALRWPVIRGLALLLWLGIIGLVAWLSANGYRHAKKLVERTHDNAG